MPVDHLGTLLVPQAYGQHLEQPGLDLSLEVSVGLDTTHNEYPISLHGYTAQVDFNTIRQLVYDGYFHAGFNWSPH